MKAFLDTEVFSDDRIYLRNEALKVISQTILELLYTSRAQALVDRIERWSKLEMWSAEDYKYSLQLIERPTHRVQAAVDAFSLMSDRDVYDFLGLEAF